jgi:hypothetical protein
MKSSDLLVLENREFTIISGGQTGADQAGLSAARTLKLPTGGWAPKGWMTEDGPDEDLLKSYGLREHNSGYRERTISNVKAADITIIISRKWKSPGTVLTMNACRRANKPFIALNEDGSVVEIYNDQKLQKQIETIRKQKDEMTFEQNQFDVIANTLKKYSVINVAGNTERNAPNISTMAFNLFYQLFSRLK